MRQFFVFFSLGVLTSISVGLPADDLNDIVQRATRSINTFSVDQEDARLSFEQLVIKYGYLVETHTVTTDDCYILTIHRIQSPKCTQANKPVVYLQHGIFSSSCDWVIIGPGRALAYVLADCCYDVWLGNFRGNVHSTKHCSMSTNKHKFWDFSWDEMAQYDLPACINYVLRTTGQSELSYVGHSQGTTVFFAFSIYHPECSKKVTVFIALAPIAYFEHCKSPLMKTMAFFSGPISIFLDMIGVDNFSPTSEALSLAGAQLCKEESKFSSMCANVLFLICGWNTELFDAALLPVIMGHSPAGSSTKQLLHYAQCIKSKKFRAFDYGMIENLFNYGSISPPDYPLDKVNVPCVFIYGENDNFAAEEDVFRLWNSLPPKCRKEIYNVPFAKFNHLDFLFAKNVTTLVYDKVIDIINKNNGRDCCNC